jgi:hypothetical protein
MPTEIYQQNEDGTTTLIEVIPDTEAPDVKSGFAVLVPTAGGSRVTVNTRYARTNMPVILTRTQNSVSAIGNIFVHDTQTVEGQSFVIRSTNASDVGEIYWEILELA